MARNSDHPVKEQYRLDTTVDNNANNYGVADLVIGATADGLAPQSFLGVTVLIESIPQLARVELWLPKVADGSEARASFDIEDYFYAGLVCCPARVSYSATGETASYGSASWALAGYPGCLLRVRGGGSAGACSISATAY
jgi:hypothetical protein